MQELAARLRQGGLNIFRHRRGMLFVSPIRARVFSHESAGVSASINAILEKVTSASGINRKTLAEHLAPAGAEPADLERARLTLASDLHWLVSEGYVIEFNDGSLDLPRTKPPAAPAAKECGKTGWRDEPDVATEPLRASRSRKSRWSYRFSGDRDRSKQRRKRSSRASRVAAESPRHSACRSRRITAKRTGDHPAPEADAEQSPTRRRPSCLTVVRRCARSSSDFAACRVAASAGKTAADRDASDLRTTPERARPSSTSRRRRSCSASSSRGP